MKKILFASNKGKAGGGTSVVYHLNHQIGLPPLSLEQIFLQKIFSYSSKLSGTKYVFLH